MIPPPARWPIRAWKTHVFGKRRAAAEVVPEGVLVRVKRRDRTGERRHVRPYQTDAAHDVRPDGPGAWADDQIGHCRKDRVGLTWRFAEEVLRIADVFLEAEDRAHRYERHAEVRSLLLAIGQADALA